MKKKLLALTLAAFVACGAAGCGGEEKKPAPKPENKQTTNVKKDEKQNLYCLRNRNVGGFNPNAPAHRFLRKDFYCRGNRTHLLRHKLACERTSVRAFCG